MSVKVTDSVGLLSPKDLSDIELVSTPHRVKAFIENPASKGELQAHVKTCVDTPNTICIGVSPGLRFTWTEIGVDTGIRTADHQQVGRAGNPDFKMAVTGSDPSGWANGIKAIISRAQVLSHKEIVGASTQTPVVITQPQTVIEKPVSAWPFIIGFGLLAAFVTVMIMIARRHQKKVTLALENAQRETAEMAARNIREQELFEKSVRTEPAPAKKVPEPFVPPPRKNTWDDVLERAKPPEKMPVRRTERTATPTPVIVQSPNNDLLTGVLIGQATAPRHDHHYSPPSYSPPPYSPPPRSRTPTPAPSFSSGSGSSFKSFSGGGGGGSFDSGSSGGSDSGGGGGGDF